MIDNIALTEKMPINTGYQNGAIRLSSVLAALTDIDGSEMLGITVGAIPTGATLTDGTHSFTATDSQHLVVVTGWNLVNMAITAPTGFTGAFALTVVATSLETATGEIANCAVTLPVTVVPVMLDRPLVADQEHGGSDHHHEQEDEGHACGGNTDIRQTQDEKGRNSSATITVQSEHAQPKQIEGFTIDNSPKNGGYGEQFKPITDWSATSKSPILGNDESSKKGGRDNSSWLSDFLGVGGSAAKQDAASLTKLVVTLGKDKAKGR